MAANNPFSPTFGVPPPVIAGRDVILEAIEDALATGPTHPDYTTLLLGIRGAGKTVMLNAAEDLARQRGWLTLAQDGTPGGLLGRVARAAAKLLADRDEPTRRRIAGVRAAGFGVEFSEAADAESRRSPGDASDGEVLRDVLTDVGRIVADRDIGLLITVDELLGVDPDEMRQFGAALQHVTRREQLPVAFIGAALPQFEAFLDSDAAATFLQRCSRYDIEPLDPAATRHALNAPVADRGGAIDEAALERAATASSGYPFMIQLVGFHSWDRASGDPVRIGTVEVSEGIEQADRRVGRLVLGPTWRGLSEMDQRFLLAMVEDEGESLMADVSARLGVDSRYASVYRQRLIAAGVVTATGRGRIDLTHHAARDWIRSRRLLS